MRITKKHEPVFRSVLLADEVKIDKLMISHVNLCTRDDNIQ